MYCTIISRRWNRLLLAVLFVVSVPGAAAEPKGPVDQVTEELKTGKKPASATVEMIMEQAVRNIAARYALNDDQTEFTRKLMKDEVYTFLEEHESEVWPVIRDLLGAQLRPPENRDDMMRIGKAARPLAEMAKKAIFDANDRWHHILTPEQKKTHDFDMAEMTSTFDHIDSNFSEWSAGKSSNENIFPEPDMMGDPPRPKKPPAREPVVEVFDPKHVFETLVEEFIKDYSLDKGQITAARSILEEFKVKANDYRAAKKREFADLAARQNKAIEEHDLGAIKRATKDHKKLLKPIYQLSEQLGDRLKGLLTTSQIQRFADKGATRGTKAVERSKQTSAAVKKQRSATDSSDSESNETPPSEPTSDRD